MKTKLAISILVFVSLLISASESEGCSCVYVTPDSNNIDVVFAGKLLKEPDEKEPTKYKVEISEIFRGLQNQKTVEIYYSVGCGAAMLINKDYLFMASRDEKTGKISVQGCSYSYENAHQHRQMIEILRWKKNPQNQGGIIAGKIAENMRWRTDTRKPAEINKVYLEDNQNNKFEVIIEDDGFYKFTNLKEGIYKLYLQLPETLTTYGDANGFDWLSSVRTNIKISGNNGLIEDFFIQTNGIISGKVSDENKQPVGSIEVNLYFLDEQGEETLAGLTETDYSGSYTFKGLSPGKYLIKIGAKDWYLNPTSKNIAFPLTYFPNHLSRTKAEVIQIGKAEFLKDKNIYLTNLKKRAITGQITLEDGSPAVNAHIMVQVQRENDSQKMRSGSHSLTNTDFNGKFLFYAYEDTEYLIQADIFRATGLSTVEVLFSSDCFIVPKTGEISQVKIVLKKGFIECNKEKFGF